MEFAPDLSPLKRPRDTKIETPLRRSSRIRDLKARQSSKDITQRTSSKTVPRNDSLTHTRSSGLLKLPMELVERIAVCLQHDKNFVDFAQYNTHENLAAYGDHLPQDNGHFENFFNFRLTCRQMHAMTSDTFRRNYFTRRMVKLQERSLRNLLEISTHPILGQQVLELMVSPERHTEDDLIWLDVVVKGAKEKVEKAGHTIEPEELKHVEKCARELRERLERSVKSDDELHASDLPAELLSQALKQLPSLQSVNYGNYGEYPDLRHDEKDLERLWMGVEVHDNKRPGNPWYMNNEFWLERGRYNTDIVLSALQKCSATRTFPKLRFRAGSLTLAGLSSLSELKTLGLAQSFRGLKSLYLSFSAAQEAMVEEAHIFITAAPLDLQELTIDFTWDGDFDSERTKSLIRELLPKINFPNLGYLEIKGIVGALSALPRIIANHRKSLISLFISHDFHVKDAFNDWEAKWSTVLEACLQVEKLVNVVIFAESNTYYRPREEDDIVSYDGSEVDDGELWIIKYKDTFPKSVPEWRIEASARRVKEQLEFWIGEWKWMEDCMEQIVREEREKEAQAEQEGQDE
ncbi:uncharacterized protein BKA78DRAFT_339514 [Phyllosticta capitalensis]|uniref:uncharacterized protein n=1 Tax=Phyllosticta capitalensis TaxID=121624 RepID=UPI00312FAEDD